VTEPESGGSKLREWGRSLAFALVAWLVLRTFVVQAFHITSESMETTLLTGDVLWVARPTYGIKVPFTNALLPGLREPRHGDIVIFESVETPGLDVVKRVIGLPGDTVGMKDGAVVRNGQPVAEPYAHRARPTEPDPPGSEAQMRAWQQSRLVGGAAGPYRPTRNDWGPVVVPPGSLLVMGDNRDSSYDGRWWGFLPRRNLRGSPLVVYYSFDPSSWRPLPLLTATRWSRLFTIPR